MMKRIAFITLLAACVAALPTSAQGPSTLSFGGSVLNRDVMSAGSFASMVQPQNFGSARSMAMGGAFTSLGGDMASMSINPAGLGMYRRSEITLTPMMGLSGAETPGTGPWQGNNKNRFSLASFGAVFNVKQNPTGALTSLTIGFGMNRIADFNTRYSYSSESRYDPANPDRLMPTIADIFGQQLGQAGIFPDKEGNLGYNINPYFWPAVLGYNAFLISPGEASPGGEKMWAPNAIGRNASVLHSVDVINSGAINEFSLSMGANINNFLYLGATLGLQSVSKREQTTYQEEYGYFNTEGGVAVDKNGQVLPQQLGYMSLWQQSRIEGSGVNFKLGAIVRPVKGLRLGIAFHTPTYYSLDRSYDANIESKLVSNKEGVAPEYPTDAPPEAQYDEGGNRWAFVSPTRLLFGASYTLGYSAVLSIDYERDWYNGIRAKNLPAELGSTAQDYKMEFKNNFCATNAIRVGLEVKPFAMLALRVGGGYTSSMLKDESLYFDSPVATQSHYITAGVGLTLSRTAALDFGYQYQRNSQTEYQLFFSQDVDTKQFFTESGLYKTSLTRHFISMTLGFRF